MDVISSSGLAEVQEYLTIWNYVYDPLILGMNQELFDSLSTADQQLVLDAAQDANEFQVEANRRLEKTQVEEQSRLMEVTELTDDEVNRFRQAVRPLYDEYADVWGPALTDAVTPER